MKLTIERIQRYLNQQQRLSNYIFKLETPDRKRIKNLAYLLFHLMNVEEQLEILLKEISDASITPNKEI